MFKKRFLCQKPKTQLQQFTVFQIGAKLQLKLAVYPLLTCRHFHNVLDQWRNPLYFTQKNLGVTLETTFQTPEATFMCHSTEGAFKEQVNWVNRLFYRAEASRGEASVDDCFQPGHFEIEVPAQSEKQFALPARSWCRGSCGKRGFRKRRLNH